MHFSHFVTTITLGGRQYYYPHFNDEEITKPVSAEDGI